MPSAENYGCEKMTDFKDFIDVTNNNNNHIPLGDVSRTSCAGPDAATTVTWSYLPFGASGSSMQEIVPGLFLGPYSAALRDCRPALTRTGITHIVCVRQDTKEAHFIKPQFGDDARFTYLTLDIADLAQESIIRYFPQVRAFVDQAFLGRGKVLVHGKNGNSRSATLVMAYVMEKFGLNSIEALNLVKGRRNCIEPNEGFVAQLSEYEPIYKARQSLEQGASSNNQRQKRKSEQLAESFEVDLIQPPPSPASLIDGAVSMSMDYHRHQDEMHDISGHLHRLWLLKTS